MIYLDEPIESLHQKELCEIEGACICAWEGVWVLGLWYESECVSGKLSHSISIICFLFIHLEYRFLISLYDMKSKLNSTELYK